MSLFSQPTFALSVAMLISGISTGGGYMQQIPAEVREYLSTNDTLYRAQLSQRYPHLPDTLTAPTTQTAVLNWLSSDEAWDQSLNGFVVNCLMFLRSDATPEKAQIVRNFLVHADPYVRLHAYEFLLTLYFPNNNPEALLMLLQTMLLDADDSVRAQAASYIERANAVAELRDFLKSWLKGAQSRGWAGSESFELVEHLLQK